MSLLFRLMLLAAVSVLPSATLEIWRTERSRQQNLAEIPLRALRLAEIAAAEQGRIIEGTRQLLTALSLLSVIRDRDLAQCEPTLHRLREQFPAYTVIGVAEPGGRIWCSSAGRSVDISDRQGFSRAVETGGFVVGGFVVGRITGRRTLNLFLPVRTEAGEVTGVLNAGLDLDLLAQDLARRETAPGITLTVADRQGTVLVDLPDGQEVGRLLPRRLQPILQAQQPGVADLAWTNGTRQVVGYVPAAGYPAPSFLVAVGLDHRQFVAKPYRLGPSLLLSAAVLTAALLAAWFFATHHIRRPIARLAAVGERWRRGDMQARAGQADRNSEIGQLALAFDGMAEAVAEREAALRAGEERWQAVFQSMQEGFALCEIVYDSGGEVSDYRFLELNQAWEQLTGLPNAQTLGLTAGQVFRKIDPFWARTFGHVVATGEPAHFQREIASIRRWYDVVAYRTGPNRFAALFLDITARRAAEQRQALLSREVDHRAKNALTVVQATLRLTRATDLAAYRQAVEGRVSALARAQSILARDRWTGADLRWLLEAELEPFLGAASASESGVRLDGPAVTIPSMAVQPLAMVIHELATNAMKFGALSAGAGRLSVSWDLLARPGEAPLLGLHWAETDGPGIVAAPERRGFGSRLLDGTIRRQLGGSVSFAWEATGLVCDIEIPLVEDTDLLSREP